MATMRAMLLREWGGRLAPAEVERPAPRADKILIKVEACGVGVHLVQMVRIFGGEVIAVDIDDTKLARVGEYGASSLVNFRDPSSRAAVLAATDGVGPDVVVDLVGRPETLEWGLAMLGRGGRLVLLTTFREIGITFTPRHLVLEEVTVTGSRYASKFELLAAINLVRDGKIRPVVSEVVPFERVEELHEQLRRAEFFARGAAVVGTAVG